MKKIIILLFLSTLVKAQIVQPKSTTTFSNVRATGSMTVASKLRVGSTVAPSSTLDVTGTMSISGTSTLTGAVETKTINNSVGNLNLNSNGNTILQSYGSPIITAYPNNLIFSPVAGNNTGVPYSFSGVGTYSNTASTNIPFFKVTGATRGWLTGAIATQYENYFTAPTYTAAGASTITTAAGLYVAKPIMGTNMTATSIFGIQTDGGISTTGGRIIAVQGADVASAAGAITLGSDGNVFELTGTSAVTLISNIGYQNGAEITLIFTSTASLTDGTANSGTNIGFELAGNVNFTGSAEDLITLVLCEIGGTQRWREKCRSVN